jgi:hypothetical protein
MKIRKIITPILVSGLLYVPYAEKIVRHFPLKNGNEIVATIDTDNKISNNSLSSNSFLAKSLASDFASYKTNAVSKAAVKGIVLYTDVDVALKSRDGDITRHYILPIYGDAFDNNPDIAKLFQRYNFITADTSFTSQKEDDVRFNEGYAYKVTLPSVEDSLVSRIQNGEPTTNVRSFYPGKIQDAGRLNELYTLNGRRVTSDIKSSKNISNGIYFNTKQISNGTNIKKVLKTRK